MPHRRNRHTDTSYAVQRFLECCWLSSMPAQARYENFERYCLTLHALGKVLVRFLEFHPPTPIQTQTAQQLQPVHILLLHSLLAIYSSRCCLESCRPILDRTKRHHDQTHPPPSRHHHHPPALCLPSARYVPLTKTDAEQQQPALLAHRFQVEYQRFRRIRPEAAESFPQAMPLPREQKE